MKVLKFKPELIELMRRGEKTVTWRLFDDKNLAEGDDVSLVDKSTLYAVGTARIARIVVRPLGALYVTDPDGHEKYTSKEDMLATYRSYYGSRVTLETEVKVITFRNIHIPVSHVLHGTF